MVRRSRTRLTTASEGGGSRFAWTDSADDAAHALADIGVAALRGALPLADCDAWVRGIYAARSHWTADFGDDQFSLGRAFYTHLEQGRSAAYFAEAAESDSRVELHAPGLQSAMRALAATLAGGEVRPRRGWCGAGLHIFPAHGHVARHGGVIHFDTEGLTDHHLARRARALSVVCMLQPPARSCGREGGLRVWEVEYAGEDGVDEHAKGAPGVTAVYGVGDAVVFDSYRLHQIQPFGGDTDRISATIHLAEVDAGHFESWF